MKLIKKKSTLPSTSQATKVLVTDDDEAMRLLLREAISQWGFQVIEASNGEEAWEIMQKPDAPRLLILDWRMPKMDGITLCERIRNKLHYYPYIIFLSEVSGATNIIRGFDAGADEFLLKPVNFEELRSHIFAGERIMKFLKMIDEQNIKLKHYDEYTKILEQLLLSTWGK